MTEKETEGEWEDVGDSVGVGVEAACEQWEAVRVAAVIDLHVGSLESFCRLSSLFAALTK